ncbi:hypothetical protein CMI45_02880 [Candidatus Pacearchaeota archaeon]|nr:hypothetical protein [Candidatus Pacearchaeota archaeon]|tara:strand:+ start:1826 stop:2023 length:198 start_codon:yes stop_codon:yes gene_type:complete
MREPTSENIYVITIRRDTNKAFVFRRDAIKAVYFRDTDTEDTGDVFRPLAEYLNLPLHHQQSISS